MGGAFVVLPFMTGYLRVPTHTAHATSAAVVFLTALSGSIMFYMATGDSNQDAAKSNPGELNQSVSASSASSVSEASSSSTSSLKAASGSNVDLATALALSAASVPMSLVGVRLARNLSAFTLHTMLGGWMLVVAPLSLYADSIKQQRTNEAAPSSPQSISSRAQLTQPDWINERSWLRDFCSKYNLYFRDTQHSLSAIGIGSFSGVLAGMFGVGYASVTRLLIFLVAYTFQKTLLLYWSFFIACVSGGALMVPAMCTFTDLDYKTVIGTSMASIIPVSFASSVAQIWARSLSFSLAIPLGIGCSVGAIVGAKIAKKVDDQYLKYVFVSIMGISGAQRLWKAAQVKLLKK
jgi:uncharacterized membrane protein YfcA